MACLTAIGRRRRSGEPTRRARDRHDDDVHPPATNGRFGWHRDAERITELAANDDIIAVMRRCSKERFHETSSHFLRHQ
jgi:hypothetical protein